MMNLNKELEPEIKHLNNSDELKPLQKPEVDSNSFMK